MDYKDFLTKLDGAHEYERYISGMCPFDHHKTPALLVFKDGWFRCLGCDRTGSWKMLWNKLSGQYITIRPDKKVSWNVPNIGGEELEQLCYQSHSDLMNFTSFQWYLEERGLEGRIEINELGYHEGWYTIPVYGENGSFITSVFRAAPFMQEATQMRYYCKHVPVPYCPDWRMLNKEEYLYVVFGMFDALTLADLRLPVITGTSGKENFNPEWLNNYRKTIYIIPDLGEEDTAYELAKNLGWRGRVMLLDFPQGKKDTNGFYEVRKGEDLRRQLERRRLDDKVHK